MQFPAVGGEGVRTELSLPNVGKTIGAVEGNSKIILSSMLIYFSAFVRTIQSSLMEISSFIMK